MDLEQSSGGPREVLEASWRNPWETSKTLFLEVNLRFFFKWSKLILMFSVLGRFVKRSVVIGSCLLFHVFLLFFEACIVAKE